MVGGWRAVRGLCSCCRARGWDLAVAVQGELVPYESVDGCVPHLDLWPALARLYAHAAAHAVARLVGEALPQLQRHVAGVAAQLDRVASRAPPSAAPPGAPLLSVYGFCPPPAAAPRPRGSPPRPRGGCHAIWGEDRPLRSELAHSGERQVRPAMMPCRTVQAGGNNY